MVKRLTSTKATISLLEEIVGQHGQVLFHQSGGCCDGSAPMCFPRDEFRVGAKDVYLGNISGQPFFIAADQFNYWEHTQLIIDVVDGRGGMFSLEGPTGKRFLTRSRVFSNEEFLQLQKSPPLRANEINKFEGLMTTS